MAAPSTTPTAGKLHNCCTIVISLILLTDCISEGFLTYAVESVLSEPRFKFETQAAKTAYQLTSVFVQSKDVHQHRIIRFANILEEKLKTCFITTHRTQKLKQEKM